jgi:hypothetical protein
MNGKLRPFNVLQAPYIRVMSEVIMPGQTNGKPNIKFEPRYIVSPSAKKISTYIVNQIFGSELVTQTEGLNINWLMPVLKEALETAIYQEESFIYLHKFDNKVYLECIKKSDIHDLVQKFDKLYSATLIQDFNEVSKDYDYMLKRHITIENGISVLRFEAFEKSKKGTEYVQISIQKFNQKTDNDFLDKYVLPYEVLINIDLGQNFFKDSEKLLNEEMKILNTIAEEIEKTKTRIVTTQHYQSSDIVTSWKPGNSFYDIQTISVNNIADYFTLLPGDKEHQMFEFLQGDVRIEQYVSTFKFYDYQCIQNAGLSPASFGYEKDAYQNVANIDLSKNASDMTIEAIKTQIEPQLNNLFSNIIKLQQSQLMTENLLPDSLVWDYGANEKFDDMKKIQVLRSIQGVTAVPVKTKMKIIMPIIEKLIDKDYVKSNQKEIDEIVNEWTDENKDIEVKFGEV